MPGSNSISVPLTLALGIRRLGDAVDEVEAAFNPIQSRFEPVHPAIENGEILFDVSHSHLEVVDVLGHAVELSIEPPKHLKNEIFRFVGHFALAIPPYSAASKVAPG